MTSPAPTPTPTPTSSRRVDPEAGFVDVTRTHLELRGLEELRPARVPRLECRLARTYPISVPEYRELYALIGSRWLWRDRLLWTDAELASYLASPDVHVWLGRVGGETAGFFELLRTRDLVELMYFGLTAPFMGHGLGGWLLTRAAQEAFALGAQRLILNTCTLDAPQALPNYLARGFRVVREERYRTVMPQSASGAAGEAREMPGG